jgi:hypothetical protein
VHGIVLCALRRALAGAAGTSERGCKVLASFYPKRDAVVSRVKGRFSPSGEQLEGLGVSWPDYREVPSI